MFELFTLSIISFFVLWYSGKEKSPKNLTKIIYSSEVKELKEKPIKEETDDVKEVDKPAHEGFKSQFDYIDVAGLDDLDEDSEFKPKDVSEQLLKDIKNGGV